MLRKRRVTCQHGLLLLGGADEAAYPLDELTLGLHLFVFTLLRQKHDCQTEPNRTQLKFWREKQMNQSQRKKAPPFLFFSFVTTVMDIVG